MVPVCVQMNIVLIAEMGQLYLAEWRDHNMIVWSYTATVTQPMIRQWAKQIHKNPDNKKWVEPLLYSAHIC